MLRKMLKLIVAVIGIFFVVLLHTVCRYILPDPFSQIHVIFLCITLYILWSESGIIVWYTFLMMYGLETMRSGNFGILLFSGTIATLAGYWLFRYVFTNRSWYVAIALSAVMIFLHRLIYIISRYILTFGDEIPQLVFSEILTSSVWEIILTSSAAGIIYILLIYYAPRLSTTKVTT